MQDTETTEPVLEAEAAPEAEVEAKAQVETLEAVPIQELLPEVEDAGTSVDAAEPIVDRTDEQLRAILEAIIYITDEPLTMEQMAVALVQPRERVTALLNSLTAEYARPEHGLAIQEVAGGYKMATKAEHHESVRAFVRNLKPPLKLSLPALETLAVVAYKQPITAPEIMEIRGVQGAGVLKTLLDRKLIAAAGRKNVIGKPILYKTTREFLVQFGLRDLNELPSLKEFEELGRMAIEETEVDPDPVLPLELPAGAETQALLPETEAMPEPASEPEKEQS